MVGLTFDCVFVGFGVAEEEVLDCVAETAVGGGTGGGLGDCWFWVLGLDGWFGMDGWVVGFVFGHL